MNFKTVTIFNLLVLTLFMGGCSGRSGDPGYMFHLLLIIIPIFIIGHYLNKKIDSSNESLYVIEGQLKRLSAKLEALEEKLGKKPEPKTRKK